MEVLGYGVRQLDEDGNRIGSYHGRPLKNAAVSHETWKCLLTPELELFSSLTEDLQQLMNFLPNIPQSLEVIAVCVENFAEYWPAAIDDRENNESFDDRIYYEPHVRSPQFVQDGWEFLGFDVANAWLEMIQDPDYYFHSLFPDSKSAHMFCDELNLNPEPEGPFYVYALYSICRVLRERG